jgi:hypothetical protein
LSLSLENGQWYFSLNGLSVELINYLNFNAGKIYLQFNYYNPRKNRRTNPLTMKHNHSLLGRIDITKKIKTNFQRIETTDWVNDLLYYVSILPVGYRRGIKINAVGTEEEINEKLFISTGLYYTDIGFSIFYMSNNRKINIPVTAQLDLTMNYYNLGLPINTHYELIDNTISIYTI